MNEARRTVFTTVNFLINLQMGPISQSDTLKRAKKAMQRQTLQLIMNVHKLQRK